MGVHRSDCTEGAHGQHSVVELHCRRVLEEIPPQWLQREHVLKRHPLVAHLGKRVIRSSC
jgi:hypothetical protein